MKESHFRRLALAALVSGAGLSLLAPRAKRSGEVHVNELLELARKRNPGMRAGDAATHAMQAQVTEARAELVSAGRPDLVRGARTTGGMRGGESDADQETRARAKGTASPPTPALRTARSTTSPSSPAPIRAPT